MRLSFSPQIALAEDAIGADDEDLIPTDLPASASEESASEEDEDLEESEYSGLEESGMSSEEAEEVGLWLHNRPALPPTLVLLRGGSRTGARHRTLWPKAQLQALIMRRRRRRMRSDRVRKRETTVKRRMKTIPWDPLLLPNLRLVMNRTMKMMPPDEESPWRL